MKIIKNIKFTSLVKTTFGPIRVSTVTESWWLTTVTFGLFRKVVSTLSGPAFQREKEQRKEWAERFKFPPCRLKVDKTHTFYTIRFRFNFWHEHMIEYAKMAGEILNERNDVMQLFYRLQDAESQGDIEAVHNIVSEIRGSNSHQHWRKRRPRDKHHKNRLCHRKEMP